MKNKNIIKGGYLVGVVGSDGNNTLWKLEYDCVAEKKNDNDEIVLRGFDLIFLTKTRMGLVNKG